MEKAGFGPAVVAGTGFHLTAKASLCRSWVRFSNLTHARAVSNTEYATHHAAREGTSNQCFPPPWWTKYAQVSNSQVSAEQTPELAA